MLADTDTIVREIGLVVAGGRPLFRGALLERLRGEIGFEVVGEVADINELLVFDRLSDVDILIVDSDLEPGIAETTASLRAQHPLLGVVLLTATDDVRALLSVLEAGVRGCVAKNRPIDELVHAVRVVWSGGAHIEPLHLVRLLDELLTDRMQRNDAIRVIAQLSRREREVLQLLSEGANSGKIADQLVIAPDTARTHVQNVLRKLGVHSRLEAAALAARNPVLASLLADRSF